jgi:hypothetical protein
METSVGLKVAEETVIPEVVRFDPTKTSQHDNKPKGLVDSLSKYFTPGVKRTSRTALSTLKPQTDLETASMTTTSTGSKKRKHLFSSSGEDETASTTSERTSLGLLKKKNRRIKSLDTNHEHLSDSETGSGVSPVAASVGRRRHTSSGQSQVRSLYDGLSHLYTDCDSRLRHIPNTNYAEKKRKDEGGGSGT